VTVLRRGGRQLPGRTTVCGQHLILTSLLRNTGIMFPCTILLVRQCTASAPPYAKFTDVENPRRSRHPTLAMSSRDVPRPKLLDHPIARCPFLLLTNLEPRSSPAITDSS